MQGWRPLGLAWDGESTAGTAPPPAGPLASAVTRAGVAVTGAMTHLSPQPHGGRYAGVTGPGARPPDPAADAVTDGVTPRGTLRRSHRATARPPDLARATRTSVRLTQRARIPVRSLRQHWYVSELLAAGVTGPRARPPDLVAGAVASATTPTWWWGGRDAGVTGLRARPPDPVAGAVTGDMTLEGGRDHVRSHIPQACGDTRRRAVLSKCPKAKGPAAGH